MRKVEHAAVFCRIVASWLKKNLNEFFQKSFRKQQNRIKFVKFFFKIAKIASLGEGSVKTLMHADCTFVPQRTYMTLGTLRAQLCYPLSESESKAKFSDQDLRDALIKLNLKEVAETSSNR